jgi:hypothetical protein
MLCFFYDRDGALDQKQIRQIFRNPGSQHSAFKKNT